MIKISCEDPHTIYLCFGDKRYILNYGKLIGWYRP